MRNELVLRLPEGVLFDVGDATVKVEATQMLRLVGPEVARHSVEVRVEGHTDDRPVSSSRYRSNWDLSTARAIAVMAVLLREGFPAERLSVAGYAEYRPIGSNATDEGRRQNRRVDLVVTASAVQPTEPP